MTPADWEGPDPDEFDRTVADVPSVVAVVVTSAPDERFEDALVSLGAQEYPSLTVLVVDAGSPDDPTARIGSVLADAYIRRLGEPTTFGAAANEALSAVEGANYLLFLADDVVLDPDAVSLLVEEAVRSNAGIAGPKIVDADRREVLLVVGASADKLGVPAPIVEPGEVDHEQHDGVLDVLAVPAEAMLVRADLWAELGGFDPEFGDEVGELDLCWRARIAGARVLVVPDAVVTRPMATLRERFGPDPDAARSREPTERIRMLVRNYSAFSLLRVLPQALLVSVVQAVALLLTGRARRSWAVLRAMPAALAHFGATMRARRSVQALRTVHDAEVRALQVRGFSYVRTFLAGQLHLDMRVEALTGASRDFAHTVSGGVRRPSLTFGAILSLVMVIGSRDLITGGIPAVGSFLPWPSAGDAFREFASAWRFVGVGSGSPAPPLLALMGALSTAAFGSADLARTAVVVGAIPLGAYGLFRLMLPLARSVWPPLAAAAAYAAVPVPRNAISEGRLGPLVFYALAPFMLERLLTAAGIDPFAQLPDGRPVRDGRRALLALALLTAFVAAVFPPVIALLPLMALGLLVAVPLAGERGGGTRSVAAALIAAGVAVALLFPWSIGLLLPTPDLGALGFSFPEVPSLARVLVLDSGPARVGIPWLFIAVAAHPLLVASGPRLRWVVRAWMIALAGWTAAWLPGRLSAGFSVPALEGTLVVAAVGLAMAVGLGTGVLREELLRAGLSWRQATSVLAIGGLALASIPFLFDALEGSWELPDRDWHEDLGWMSADAADGGFRVLWVGNPHLLPVDPLTLDDGTGFAITRDGPGDGFALAPPPAEGATGYVRDAVEAAIGGATERLGHMLGPLAIRYIAVPLAKGPGRFVPPEETPGATPLVAPLASGLARQIDLAELTVDPGMLLFENEAWVAAGALVPPDAAERLRESDRDDALRLDIAVARPVDGYPRAPDVRLKPTQEGRVEGVLLLGEAYDDAWEAKAGDALRPHFRALGLVNGFVVDDVDAVRVTHDGQVLRYGALGVQAALWILVVGAWIRRRRGERRALVAWRLALRDVRPGAPRVLDEVPA